MNIFFLDREPSLAAADHCDKHVSKMLIEYAQLMSTAHHKLGSPHADKLYKQTHVNHPCAIWVRESRYQYAFLWELFRELAQQYTLRYNKVHATWRKLGDLLYDPPERMLFDPWRDPPQCMPDEFKGDDCVQAYRRYYRSKPFAVWKHGRQPDWF